MKKLLRTSALLAAAGAVGLIAFGNFGNGHAQNTNVAERAAAKKPKTLKPFKSKAELDEFMKKFGSRRGRTEDFDGVPAMEAKTNTVAMSKDGAKAATDGESITNTQVAGVDEGGIVKVHGDHLVILRRGRLFTVKVGGDALKPVSNIDAYGPDIDPSGTWYDEMLISDRTIVVIGYSYQRGGTEVGLFDIDRDGHLAYRSTWHLRSNDYYSSRNYASRLVDGKLVFYAPEYLYYSETNEGFPAVRRWHKNAKPDEFIPVITPERIFRASADAANSYSATLHTVTSCSIDGDLKCEATGVVGPSGRVFYVSATNVYVWTTNGSGEANASLLYRLPLTGREPSALGVSGSPTDQFSFDERSNGMLDVIVRAGSRGDGMWKAEVSAGEVALLRVRPDDFGDGSDAAPRSRYKSLPTPNGWEFRNRFVGDYVLYSAEDWDDDGELRRDKNIYATRRTDGFTTKIRLNHGVERIEALGSDAVAIGGRGNNLYFSTIALGETPEFRTSFVQRNAAQGDERSHGFFYKPENAESGMLGLPVVKASYNGGEDSSAGVLFLRNSDLNLSSVGELKSGPATEVRDNCKASCVDWYGNARPIFLRGRVFALMGYEIVEGSFARGKIKEKQRVNFTP